MQGNSIYWSTYFSSQQKGTINDDDDSSCDRTEKFKCFVKGEMPAYAMHVCMEQHSLVRSIRRPRPTLSSRYRCETRRGVTYFGGVSVVNLKRMKVIYIS